MSYTTSYEYTTEISLASVIKNVYVWMTLALVITAVTATGIAYNPGLLFTLTSNPMLFWGACIAELVLVVTLSAAINKLSFPIAGLLFALYSVLNGVTMSLLLLVYTATSVAQTFFICAGTFGVMAVVGYTTKRDLTKLGGILFMALVGIIIATIVNIFLHSSGLALVLNYVGVLIFVGLTAWDAQNIKEMCQQAVATNNRDGVMKLALLGSLTLYLDFINLFIYLLRIFGTRRD